jgi:hypothetical protein
MTTEAVLKAVLPEFVTIENRMDLYIKPTKREHVGTWEFLIISSDF